MTEPGEDVNRRKLAIALVILASVLALVSTLNTWVERQALDTDAWVDATDQLLADDDIRQALSVYLVDELYSAISVEDAVAEALPADFDGLAGLVAGAVRGPATDAVDRLLDTEQARTTWREINRLAHSTLLTVIADDTGEVLSSEGGAVTIDFGELVRALGRRIGLSEDIVDRIPEGTGVVVLFESDELELVQDTVQAVRLLSAILFALVVVLYVAAVYLATDRRRTIRDCGIGLSVAAVLVLIARIVGVNALVEALNRAESDEPASSVLNIGSTLLRQIALTELLIGLALIGFAFVVGSSRPARALRALAAPLLRHGVASVVLGGLAVFFVLLWIKPGGPINGWFIALGLAGLCVAGVAWVQRLTVAEFPHMTFERFWGLSVAAVQGRGGPEDGSSSAEDAPHIDG